MAASGIQEHNEARRKEAFIMRRAHLRKSNPEYNGIPQSRDELAVGRIRGVEVPERQWWREQLLGAHGHQRTPQSGFRSKRLASHSAHVLREHWSNPAERHGSIRPYTPGPPYPQNAIRPRDSHMSRVEQHSIQYSAKLPNRYNNIDYTSQW